MKNKHVPLGSNDPNELEGLGSQKRMLVVWKIREPHSANTTPPECRHQGVFQMITISRLASYPRNRKVPPMSTSCSSTTGSKGNSLDAFSSSVLQHTRPLGPAPMIATFINSSIMTTYSDSPVSSLLVFQRVFVAVSHLLLLVNTELDGSGTMNKTSGSLVKSRRRACLHVDVTFCGRLQYARHFC